MQTEKPESQSKLIQLSPTVREPVERLIHLLGELNAPSDASLTVFGSALDVRTEAPKAAIPTVITLPQIELRFLHRLAEHGRRLGKLGLAAPLIMTPKYLQASLDTFPLELLEIKQRHWTVLGADPFDGLTFERVHVRLECERELKRLLIGLRQGLLAAVDRDSALQRVIEEAADNLLRTLRGLLWLKGNAEFMPTLELVSSVQRQCGREFPGIETVVAGHVVETHTLFDKLYGDVEVLSEMVNAW